MLSVDEFNELKATLDHLIEIDLLNDIKHLSTKTAENLCDLPILLHKYLSAHKKTLRELYEVESALEVKHSELFVYYKEEYDAMMLKEREIPQYIKGDEEYARLSSMRNEFKLLGDSLEKGIAILRDINWVLKNRLDYQRFNSTDL